jgi:hypothetical protein
MSQVEYIVRVEGMHNSFGLGEKIGDGITLFRAGMYNLTAEEIDAKVKQTRARKVEKL